VRSKYIFTKTSKSER